MRPIQQGATTSHDRRSLSLVIPSYNASAFLAKTLRRAYRWMAAQPRPCELLLVDDGSSDASLEIAALFARELDPGGPPFRLLEGEQNRGKGYAVKRGMLAAGGDFRVFLDTDLTYPLENVDRVVEALEGGADMAIASRIQPGSRYVVAPPSFRRLYSRHLMGRFFNLIVRCLVVRGVSDTQAGLKGMTARTAQVLFSDTVVDGFSFDVEILEIARRRRLRIVEVPVLFIYNEEPSTLSLFRDGLAMLRDIARIRRRGRLAAKRERSQGPQASPYSHPAAPTLPVEPRSHG